MAILSSNRITTMPCDESNVEIEKKVAESGPVAPEADDFVFFKFVRMNITDS